MAKFDVVVRFMGQKTYEIESDGYYNAETEAKARFLEERKGEMKGISVGGYTSVTPIQRKEADNE